LLEFNLYGLVNLSLIVDFEEVALGETELLGDHVGWVNL